MSPEAIGFHTTTCEPFAAIALTLFALCIFAVCWLGRVGREAAPGTWPRRPWLVRCLIDGREAVTFLRKIKDSIEDPYRMLLELD